MIKNYTYAACIAATLSLFTACGDDVTEVTNVNESASIDQVDKYKKLPKCEKENDGSLVFVKDSAKVYICTDKNWISMNGGNVEKDSAGVSGKDGSDGKDGSNGKDGKAGADGSDGKDGKDGKDGSSCTAKQNKNKDGYDIICNGETIGTIKNGEDGKDGKKGENGDGCTLTEGENGEVTLTCGEKSTKFFKGTCGTGSFDPATQVCGYTYDEDGNYVSGVPEPRCKDWSEIYDWTAGQDWSTDSYSLRDYFCDEKSVLHAVCKWEDEDGNIVRKTFAWDEYCDVENKKIAKKVPCAEGSKELRKPTEYCYTTNEKPVVQRKPLEVCGEGNSAKEYSPVTHFCKKSTGGLGKKSICAANPDKADKFNIDIRYMAEENVDDHTGEMCDTRDYKIYKTITSDNVTWFAQNLNYDNKQKTAALDSSSFCLGNDPANCEKGGRAYLWSAVIDSVALESKGKYCGSREEACEFEEQYQGVCPDGWHVPTVAEAKAYPKTLVTEKKWNKMEGYIDGDELILGTTNALELWTVGDKSKDNAYYVELGSVVAGIDDDKSMALYPVRCVKNVKVEQAPATESGN